MKKRCRRGCPASGGCDCCHCRWRTGNKGNVDGAIGEVAKEAGEGRGSGDNNKGCSRRGGLLAADGGVVDAIGQREAVATIEVLVTGIGGVLLQRSIMRIPLERRTLDLLHLLYPDLEYKDIRSP
ncbi:hypothetical protein GW17_00060623 [Ensete ventricosum]|nr:hypothetical protein GW17_00060623 [Ensete ventricosum]